MSDKKFELSRRNALIGLGTVGVASAGAGIGTSAYFSDQEEFTGNEIQAGELSLEVAYTSSVYQADADGASGSVTGDGTMAGEGVSGQYKIEDAKPGDSGEIEFCPKVNDNPGYVWIDAAVSGDLGSAINAELVYKDEYEAATVDTLADLESALDGGLALDNDGDTDAVDAYPADSEGRCVVLKWDWPTDGPADGSGENNDYQGDSVSFDVKFAAIQERHNGAGNNPFSS